MLNRCCVADGSLAEPPLSLQGRLLHFYGSSILTNSATDAQNTVRTELPSAHHRAWREHTRHETMCITSRVCLSTVHMCLYLIYCMCILHCGSNTTLDQRLTLKLCCKYTFRLSELEVRFSLSTRCWWGGSWGGCMIVLTGIASTQASPKHQTIPCLCDYVCVPGLLLSRSLPHCFHNWYWFMASLCFLQAD